MNGYQTTVSIDASAERVFQALSKNLADWWGEQDLPITVEGDIFKVSWGEPWYQFRVIMFIQNKEMIWECIDANQKIPGLKNIEKEWVGTKIHWKIVSKGPSRSLLYFAHEGLIPDILCFNFCTNCWNHFLKSSLLDYLQNSGEDS